MYVQALRRKAFSKEKASGVRYFPALLTIAKPAKVCLWLAISVEGGIGYRVENRPGNMARYICSKDD